jgi:hypothetical protein
MVIVINSHGESANGLIPNAFFAGGQGSPITPDAASAVMIGHANGHELFNDPVEFSSDDLPFVALGNTFTAEGGILDGWGYVRLLDSDLAGGFTEIDQLTIPETIDPAFNQGFGDLTVHEVEVPRGDPNEGGPAPDDGVLAYFSWYAGGFRVASYDASGIEPGAGSLGSRLHCSRSHRPRARRQGEHHSRSDQLHVDGSAATSAPLKLQHALPVVALGEGYRRTTATSSTPARTDLMSSVKARRGLPGGVEGL